MPFRFYLSIFPEQMLLQFIGTVFAIPLFFLFFWGGQKKSITDDLIFAGSASVVCLSECQSYFVSLWDGDERTGAGSLMRCRVQHRIRRKARYGIPLPCVQPPSFRRHPTKTRTDTQHLLLLFFCPPPLFFSFFQMPPIKDFLFYLKYISKCFLVLKTVFLKFCVGLRLFTLCVQASL